MTNWHGLPMVMLVHKLESVKVIVVTIISCCPVTQFALAACRKQHELTASPHW